VFPQEGVWRGIPLLFELHLASTNEDNYYPATPPRINLMPGVLPTKEERSRSQVRVSAFLSACAVAECGPRHRHDRRVCFAAAIGKRPELRSRVCSFVLPLPLQTRPMRIFHPAFEYNGDIISLWRLDRSWEVHMTLEDVCNAVYDLFGDKWPEPDRQYVPPMYRELRDSYAHLAKQALAGRVVCGKRWDSERSIREVHAATMERVRGASLHSFGRPPWPIGGHALFWR